MTEKKKRYLRCIASGGLAAVMLYTSAMSGAAAELKSSPELITVEIPAHIGARVINEGQAEEISPLVRSVGEAVEEATRETNAPEPEAHPKVYINGELYNGYAFICGGTTYVALRESAEALGAEVRWDAESCTAWLEMGDSRSAFVSGEGNYLVDGMLHVPVREVADGTGYRVKWVAREMAVYLDNTPEAVVQTSAPAEIPAPKAEQRSVPASSTQSDAVLWLARIIHAEAEGESLNGKIAVGNVVLNRVESELFPDTIYEVIFDRSSGVQFTPAATGKIYNTPCAEAYRAAEMCLAGVNVVGDALFFMNEDIAESSWIAENRGYLMTIGNHKFYS